MVTMTMTITALAYLKVERHAAALARKVQLFVKGDVRLGAVDNDLYVLTRTYVWAQGIVGGKGCGHVEAMIGALPSPARTL
jgi:hypothetical protein